MAIKYDVQEFHKTELTQEQMEKLANRFLMDWDNGTIVNFLRFAILKRREEMKRLDDENKEDQKLIDYIRKVDPNNKAFQGEEL